MRAFGSRRGTALISALAVVAAMSAVAVELTGDLRVSIARSGNMAARDTAYWYAQGARDYAEALIERHLSEDDRAFRPDAPWLTGPIAFPVQGGTLETRLRDAHNCFNLNALVQPQDAEAERHAGERFRGLLTALGLPTSEAERIAAQAADWIDADASPRAGGAEDSLYMSAAPPYRAANTAMAEVEEMRALAAMTPDMFALIAPHVCVLPDHAILPLNLNTLRLEDAVQLAGLFEGRLSLSQAETVLLRRPSGGYSDISGFWNDPVIAALGAPGSELTRVATTSSWFEVRVDVILADGRFSLEQTVEASPRSVRRISQRFGSLPG